MTGKGKNTLAMALCTGCSIGKCIDAEKLSSAAMESIDGIRCLSHKALCSEAGLRDLLSFTQENGVARLAVAACSPRSKTAEFSLEGIYVDRVNLREQMAWTMEAGEEDTQMYAEDHVKMVLAKLDAIKDNTPYVPEQLSKEVLVVGGGIAGLSAALEGAAAGYHIHLVEKSDRLGGYAGRIYRTPYNEIDLSARIQDVMEHPGVEVHLETRIESISGEPGAFSVNLYNGQSTELKVGSVVTATGWKPYDPKKLSSLGYDSPRVKTLEEFEAQVQTEKPPERIMFVLCAGSRDENHLAYCSSYCCGAALKQALYIREKNPSAQVYIIYRDIRTPGFQEDFYKQVQDDDGIFMTKGVIESISDQGHEVEVVVGESLLDQQITLAADLVVLATGMVPNTTTDLKLQYRLGEGLPELDYEFSDSHFICFPYETRRTGIYAAGTVRAPMDMALSQEDGAGAMMKAIQSIECVHRGEAVHPRAGDMTYPELYMERCTDCKRCTEECPFASYDETEKGTPLPNPARCRRCGICVGSCPERVIGFSDYSINSVSAVIKAVHVPDEFEEKPRILVFVCENDAYPALDAAGIHRLKISPFVRIIPVRCLGSVNKVWISDALSHGYDGILQIGCKPGDDYQCHFIHGSELTEQRGENLQETLETMMLEPERIQTRFVEITDHHEIQKIINDYVEELVLIGPNPFKDM